MTPADPRTEIARYHREHERFYAVEDLRRAVELKRWARALLVLADRWATELDAGRSGGEPPDRLAAVAGSRDLNELRAISSIGILFMEGEGRPLEIRELEGWLSEAADYLSQAGTWLLEKMDAGWHREAELPGSHDGHLSPSRFAALTGTTINALRMQAAGVLQASALERLEGLDLTPAGVRGQPDEAVAALRRIALLLERAGMLLAAKSNELSDSEHAWTTFIEGAAHGE